MLGTQRGAHSYADTVLPGLAFHSQHQLRQDCLVGLLLLEGEENYFKTSRRHVYFFLNSVVLKDVSGHMSPF